MAFRYSLSRTMGCETDVEVKGEVGCVTGKKTDV